MIPSLGYKHYNVQILYTHMHAQSHTHMTLFELRLRNFVLLSESSHSLQEHSFITPLDTLIILEFYLLLISGVEMVPHFFNIHFLTSNRAKLSHMLIVHLYFFFCDLSFVDFLLEC
jgi:hypothetical protein